MAEKVIGFDNEPKLYRVGSFVLKQVAGIDRQLNEKDPTLEVLRVLGLTNSQQILDTTVARFWDDLEATGKVKQALALVLTFDTKPKEKRFQTYTIEQVLDRMPRRTAAKVLQDFFVMNFSSMPQLNAGAKAIT